MPVFNPKVSDTADLPLDGLFQEFMGHVYPLLANEDERAIMKDAFMAGAGAMLLACTVRHPGAGPKEVESALIKMKSYLAELRAYDLLRSKEGGWRL